MVITVFFVGDFTVGDVPALPFGTDDTVDEFAIAYVFNSTIKIKVSPSLCVVSVNGRRHPVLKLQH